VYLSLSLTQVAYTNIVHVKLINVHFMLVGNIRFFIHLWGLEMTNKSTLVGIVRTHSRFDGKSPH